MFLHLVLWLSVACFSQIIVAKAQQANDSPRQVVEALNSALIEVMRSAKQLGYQGRFKKLEPIVRKTHDFESVAQIAISNHWKSLTPQQQQTFVDKLTEHSIATYAAQFNEYGGETFKYDSEQTLKPDRVLVRYFLNSPKDKPVKFDYILDKENGQWRIINIIVDGISDLALRKAQYTSIITREGFDSLLNKLSEKISDYANSKS
jgi:phospholipid transport system substrate-binding protein